MRSAAAFAKRTRDFRAGARESRKTRIFVLINCGLIRIKSRGANPPCVHRASWSPSRSLVSFSIRIGSPSKKKKFVPVKRRNLKSLDEVEFRTEILKSPLCDLNNFPSDLEEIVELYEELLTEFIDELAPVVELMVPEDPSPQWYTSECQSAKRRRRAAERKYRVILKKSVSVKELLDALRKLREETKAATKFIVQTRNNYYREQLEKAGNDTKQTYKIMNGHERNPSILPEHSDPAELCEKFMTYFKDKIDKIYLEIQSLRFDDENPQEPPKISSPPEFGTFRPVTSEELVKVIRSLNNKTCDLDPVPSKLVGKCVHELTPVIMAIVNGSLVSGVFPSVLKKAVIRPVYKGKGLDANSEASYRPISNLSFVSKIIEKCVAHQLTEHLEQHKLFAKVQSAYRTKHSCETATLKIFNDLLVLTDKRRKAVLLLLDLSAAFDTVPHATLLYRLEHMYGVKDVALAWFSSYLQGRKAFVKIGDCQSSEVEVRIGVPQGSILGPLLFILFTKDLEDIAASHGFKIHLYADDSQIYINFSNDNWTQCESQLQNCFAEVEKWMASSYLKLNPSKTELLFISSRTDKSPNPIGHGETLTLRGFNQSNAEITPTTEARNLGVMFDERLTMKAHVSKVVRDCNMSLINLRRIGDKLSKKHKIQLVHSLVHSRLDFCNGLLIGVDQSEISRLQKVQNAATRFVFGTKQWRGVTNLRKQLHFLPVTARIEFKVCLMVFKCLNNLAPSYLEQLIQKCQPKIKSLRNDATKLEKDYSTKLKSSQRAFQVSGPKLWNSLPADLRNCSDEVLFKSRLKTYLFEKSYGP